MKIHQNPSKSIKIHQIHQNPGRPAGRDDGHAVVYFSHLGQPTSTGPSGLAGPALYVAGGWGGPTRLPEIPEIPGGLVQMGGPDQGSKIFSEKIFDENSSKNLSKNLLEASTWAKIFEPRAWAGRARPKTIGNWARPASQKGIQKLPKMEPKTSPKWTRK